MHAAAVVATIIVKIAIVIIIFLLILIRQIALVISLTPIIIVVMAFSVCAFTGIIPSSNCTIKQLPLFLQKLRSIPKLQ